MNGETYSNAVTQIAYARDKIFLLSVRSGCGKSDAAIAGAIIGINESLEDPKIKPMRLVVFRNPREVGEKIGFLPGDALEKSEPWFEAVADIAARHNMTMPNPVNDKEVPWVELRTPTHAKGITLNDCYILIEEGQDMNHETMKTLIKRVGKNSVVIITGDYQQADTKYLSQDFKMLIAGFEINHDNDNWVHIDFTGAKNFRSALCQEISQTYDEDVPELYK